jgi:hypothetical protein
MQLLWLSVSASLLTLGSYLLFIVLCRPEAASLLVDLLRQLFQTVLARFQSVSESTSSLASSSSSPLTVASALDSLRVILLASFPWASRVAPLSVWVLTLSAVVAISLLPLPLVLVCGNFSFPLIS